MRITFSDEGWDDYQHWVTHDRAVLRKINRLIGESRRTPFSGIGKPEPLQGELKGFWSRRITQEHRFIYRMTGAGEDQTLEILACRYHYR